ncbi:MAG TPA: tetratricopeptide repeat protein [Gemmataceae bacterium]|jgi:TolA-binding protein|nr:tetratricopeptide repeat protein [Gemmataceae bacterium]
MRYLAVLLIVGTCAALSVPLRAEEPPHLAFVRALRARGMADLALEYLQSQSKNPPADLAPILPLELAKTRLELAASKPDPASRLAEQNQARAEFELFLKNNPQHPLAAEASLEIARIIAIQGKTELSKARQADKNVQAAGMAKARALFDQAGPLLQAAAERIDAQLAALAATPTSQSEAQKQALTEARQQAELEIGINLLNQAQSYTGDSDAAKRGELFKKAIDVLEKLSRRDPKNPICWQARTWLGRCYLENEDPKAARKIFNEVIAEPGEYAEPGKRLARYFRLQTLAGDDPRKAAADIRKACEEWLIVYPNHHDTPEGYGVRFELAAAYKKQAQMAAKNSNQARILYDQALKLFQAIEQTDNEFSTQAQNEKQLVIVQASQERTRGDISKLANFEECYLRAQVEVGFLSEESKKLKGAELDNKRKERLKNMLEALNRGLDLADAGASPEAISNARFLLAYAYYALEDYYRAAVLGEDVARTEAKSRQAPSAAVYALESYYALLRKQEEAGAGREDQEPDRARMIRLAHYIEQTWPADTAADIARHMLGSLALADKNYAEAVATLERITPGYADSIKALYLLAGAAFQAHKEETKPVPGQPSYQDRALAALLRLPELPAAADPVTVRDYFNAKQILAGIYYRTKQYEKMETLTAALVKKADELEGDVKAEQRSTVLGLSLYAKLGRAEAEYDAGRHAKAREMLEPLVKDIQNPALAEQFNQLKDRDPEVLRAILGLALRASVQDNQVVRGREILELLQKTFPDNSIDVLKLLVQQLNAQIKDLRGKGDAAKTQLDQTLASVALFLDVLAKQQEQAKTPNPEFLLFVAQSYSSLDKHALAAELANKVSEPAPEPGKKDTDPRAQGFYHAARLLVARELRLAAQSENKDFAKAQQALADILKTPWGKRSIDVQMERVRLLEAQEKYVLPNKQGAVYEWADLMRTMQSRTNDNKIKEQYYDCYYHRAYCIYKYALQLTDAKKRTQYVRTAASYIVKLEALPDEAAETARKRFQELLSQEPALKEQYDELKKNAP